VQFFSGVKILIVILKVLLYKSVGSSSVHMNVCKFRSHIEN